MSGKVRFLTHVDIIALHDDAMAMADQPSAALVRPEALESAVAQAKNIAWYMDDTPAELTVHLCTHVALARAWVDGNTRTAAYAGVQFAGINGGKDPSPEEYIQYADLLLKYIEGDQDTREEVFKEFVEFVDG